jgi:hypothetical protein
MSDAEPDFERTIVVADEAELSALARAADVRGWTKVYTNYCAHGEYEQTLWTTSEVTRVRYLEHHTTGTRFVSVYGDSAGEVEQAADVVRAALPTVTEDEILDQLLADDAPAPVDIVRGFRKLGITHYVTRVHAHRPGPLDARYTEAVSRHVAHPHRQVRLTLMLVADELATLWPELTEPIIARHGHEEELADLVEAFVEVAESRG